MNLKTLTLACLSTVLFGTAAHAAGTADEIAQIKHRLQDRDSLVAEKVTPTPMKGIYEVWLNGQPFYVDAQVDHIIHGDMFDANTRENLTEKSRHVFSKDQFKKLPYQYAVKQTFGNGKRQLVVFSDPACTYCRVLEQAFAKVNNLTVHTFVLSVLPPGPVSVQDILCAPDKAKAWDDWMGKGIEPKHQPETCDHGVADKIYQLAGRYDLRGVPLMVFPNGEVIRGALNATQLNAVLDQNQ